MPDDRDAVLFSSFEERPYAAVGGVEVLVGGPDLEPAEPELVHTVVKLRDGIWLVRVDGCPAGESFRVGRNVLGDGLVGHPHTSRSGLEPKDDRAISRLRSRPMLVRS